MIERVGLDAAHVLLQPRVELLDEVLDQERDVARALAQRRQADRHHVQAVVEILAKGAGRDLLLQIAVGRGDQPHVDADRLDAAHALELALLQGAQQLHLHLDGDRADLVEEQRAAVASSKRPGFEPTAPVKAPRS